MSPQSATTALDEAMRELTGSEADELSIANNPAAADTVGRALAAVVADDVGHADVVAVWEAPNDAVLAHIVARELGAGIAQASNVEGILELDVPLPPDARVVLLADRFRDENMLIGLASLVNHRGGHVVGAAAVRTSPALTTSAADVPCAVLRLPPDETSSEERVR